MTMIVRLPGKAGERRLHPRLAFGIERAGGFIEQQNRRFGDKRAGQRDALALAAGEIAAALACRRVPAARQAVDEIARGGLGRLADLVVGGARSAERDVLAHRGVEQECVLRDQREIAAQRDAAGRRAHRARRHGWRRGWRRRGAAED